MVLGIMVHGLLWAPKDLRAEQAPCGVLPCIAFPLIPLLLVVRPPLVLRAVLASVHSKELLSGPAMGYCLGQE